MSARPESDYPTVSDMREAMDSLIQKGLGDLPVQILLAPDSTLQAIARCLDPGRTGKPALMIDLVPNKGGRMAASIISADRLSGRDLRITAQ